MKRLLFLLSIFICRLLPAQHDTICAPVSNRIFIGVSGHFGFLWSHRYNMGHLVQKHIGGGEIDIWRNANDGTCWQQPYHYPGYGLALQIVPLGNPEQLGTAIGLFPYINFPIGSRDRKFKMNVRIGWGAGWITKRFEPIENHKNTAIGSHLNTGFMLRFSGMYRIDAGNYIEAGIGLTHFSNGSARLPNLGINLPMLALGYHFAVKNSQAPAEHPRTFNRAEIDEVLADRKWHFSALLVFGANDIQPPAGNRFGVCNVLTYAMKQTSRKSRWGGGLDVMYSQGIRHILVYDSVNVSVADAAQPGIKFCYELVLGRISFPMEFGAYLYSRYTENGPVYSRFCTHYLVTRKLILNFSIKTHFAKAEYFEFGAGWRF
jgi:hypothetical protein